MEGPSRSRQIRGEGNRKGVEVSVTISTSSQPYPIENDSQEQFAAEGGGFGPMAETPQEIKQSKASTKEAEKAQKDAEAREALAIALRDVRMHFDGEKYW